MPSKDNYNYYLEILTAYMTQGTGFLKHGCDYILSKKKKKICWMLVDRRNRGNVIELSKVACLA